MDNAKILAEKILKETLQFKVLNHIATCVNEVTNTNSCKINKNINGYQLIVRIAKGTFYIRRKQELFFTTTNKGGCIKSYYFPTISKVIYFIFDEEHGNENTTW